MILDQHQPSLRATMAQPDALPDLLSQLTSSLTSTQPSFAPETVVPPTDGISLLDTKNELFLSYLQNLVFLIIVKLQRYRPTANTLSSTKAKDLDDAVVKQLVELRLYLEKGIRPLEGRLKYQIEKVLRAAEHANSIKSTTTKSGKKSEKGDDNRSAGSASDPEEDELAYRPNAAALSAASKQRRPDRKKGGIYRPPHINPTAMPTTDTPASRRRNKPVRSAAIDNYIDNEVGNAPTAEASIGSTIARGGKGMKSDKDKRRDEERTRYEEANFMRLPRESKKDRMKRKAGESRGFGATDFGLGSLGEMGDRVMQATKGPKRRKY